MKKFVFIIVIALFASTSVVMAQEPVDETDREMIELLRLNDEQALAYSTIMQRQRTAFLAREPRRWQQQLAFYEQTFAMLRPVLTEEQYAGFVAFIDSVIEETQDEDFLAME